MLEIVLLVMGILAEFLAKTNNNIKLGLPPSVSSVYGRMSRVNIVRP